MAMMIYPTMRLHGKSIKYQGGIDSDMVVARDFLTRYLKGLPPEPGDVPGVVKATGRHGFPDAIGYSQVWILSPRLHAFIQDANGPEWPLRACDMTFVTKSGQEFPFKFVYGPPRFHRYNHDRRTYPTGKKPSHRQDQYRWVEKLSGDLTPSGRTMRPHRPGDPVFWEDAGSFEGDTLWSGGGLDEKYVSDPFWERLNEEFPEKFRARPIAEKAL